MLFITEQHLLLGKQLVINRCWACVGLVYNAKEQRMLICLPPDYLQPCWSPTSTVNQEANKESQAPNHGSRVPQGNLFMPALKVQYVQAGGKDTRAAGELPASRSTPCTAGGCPLVSRLPGEPCTLGCSGCKLPSPGLLPAHTQSKQYQKQLEKG